MRRKSEFVKKQSTWLGLDILRTHTVRESIPSSLLDDPVNAAVPGQLACVRVIGSLSLAIEGWTAGAADNVYRLGLQMVNRNTITVGTASPDYALTTVNADQKWKWWEDFPMVGTDVPAGTADYYRAFRFDWSVNTGSVARDMNLALFHGPQGPNLNFTVCRAFISIRYLLV